MCANQSNVSKQKPPSPMGVFTIPTYAKLNLSLIIYPPRKDGYHPLCSIFQSIALSDTLTITKKPKDYGFTCRSSHPKLSDETHNILYKIYHALKKTIPFGLEIDLEKRIPIGSGMGGGSSNAAGFLQFLNTEAGWKYPVSRLTQIAKRFGADIPFFLTGGTALVRGIGDKITPLTIKVPRYYLLLMPPIMVNTAQIYAAFDRSDIHEGQPVRTPAHLLKNPVHHNSLQAITLQEYPKLNALLTEINTLHPPPLHMTGSGSTFFIPFDSKTTANHWHTLLSQKFPTCNWTIAQKL